MTSSLPARRFDWRNLRLRILSGVVLGPTSFAVIAYGHWPLLVLVAVALAFLALEWGVMCARAAPGRIAILVAVGVLAPLFVAYTQTLSLALLVLVLSAFAAAAFARGLKWSDRSADIAFGVLYLGVPGITLLWLRHDPGGLGWAATLLVATWSADVCAFAAGNVLRGPKLWPGISPNKTWSGFAFGLFGATLAAQSLAYTIFGANGPGTDAAWAVGLCVGLATMAGDLWESLLKRRFGVKDSGDLIPGHGGLLDRVDGLMFAIVIAAMLRFAWPSLVLPIFHARVGL